MNKMKFVLLFAASLALASCGSSTEKSEEGAKDSSKTENNATPTDHVDGAGSETHTDGGSTETGKVDAPVEDGSVKVDPKMEDPKKLDPKGEDPKKLDPKGEEPKKLKVN